MSMDSLGMGVPLLPQLQAQHMNITTFVAIRPTTNGRFSHNSLSTPKQAVRKDNTLRQNRAGFVKVSPYSRA
jgi:hypothetical protein